MIILKPITRDCAMIFRDVRLRALRDTPTAFGSTFANESQLSDLDWENRAVQWNGERSVAFLAWDANLACGIVAGFVDRNDATRAQLVSMWVAPSHRRLGVGRRLVSGVIDWARSMGVERLLLTVTSNNEAALGFYENLGFTKTGRTEPYPNDAALVEFEMMRIIAQPTGRVADQNI
jgi:ribosomal protein S18 acetylase RimI-like enzyme